MPSNAPGFGTGYVDWGNYVNANQPGIQADRAKVADYMQGLDTSARGMLPAFDPQAPGQSTRPGQPSGFSPEGTDPFGVTKEAIDTGQQALKSSGGFEQVLAAANANYDPVKGAAAGKGPPQAAFDPFSAALEGQNASSLYNPSTPVAPANAPQQSGPAPLRTTPTTTQGPGQQPTGTSEGPGGAKPKRGPNLEDPNAGNEAANPWGTLVQPYNPHKRGP